MGKCARLPGHVRGRWYLPPAGGERGRHGFVTRPKRAAPLLTGRNRVLRAEPLAGVQGAEPPGLTDVPIRNLVAGGAVGQGVVGQSWRVEFGEVGGGFLNAEIERALQPGGGFDRV